LAKQFPNSRTGLVEFENTARRNINENRSLIQALRDNLRIGAHHKMKSKLAQGYHLPKKASQKWARCGQKDFLLGADFNRNLVMS
jgi:hypothetical protein